MCQWPERADEVIHGLEDLLESRGNSGLDFGISEIRYGRDSSSKSGAFLAGRFEPDANDDDAGALGRRRHRPTCSREDVTRSPAVQSPSRHEEGVS